MSSRSVAVAVAAVVASGAAVALTDRSPTAVHSTDSGTMRVVPTQADLFCPTPPALGDAATSAFAVAPKSRRSTTTEGTLDLAQLRPGSSVVARVTQTGQALRRTVAPSETAGLLASASGSLAPGVSAITSSKLSSREASGLATTWCGSGANDWWFSSVDTSVGATSTLVVSNPTPAVTVVDLSLFGPDGHVTPAGARGVAIAPWSVQTINLARFAPGAGALTVNVHATQGSMVAAVFTTKLQAISPVGSDWNSPSAAPASDVVVNPAPSTSGRQQLVVTNTTARAALAHVRVFDATGTFAPTQLVDLRVGPGAVVVKDLTTITNGRAAGVRVTGNVALSAALVTTESTRGADFTTTTSSAPLTGPAVVPLLRGAGLSLLLTTAEQAGGVVRVRAYDASGEQVDSFGVHVRGAAVTTWTLPRRVRAAYLVLRARAEARIRGTASYRNADGLASLPVLSGAWSIRQPVVVPAAEMPAQTSVDRSTRR